MSFPGHHDALQLQTHGLWSDADETELLYKINMGHEASKYNMSASPVPPFVAFDRIDTVSQTTTTSRSLLDILKQSLGC